MYVLLVCDICCSEFGVLQCLLLLDTTAVLVLLALYFLLLLHCYCSFEVGCMTQISIWLLLYLRSCLPPSYSSIHMATESLKPHLVSLNLIFKKDGYSDVSVMKAKKSLGITSRAIFLRRCDSGSLSIHSLHTDCIQRDRGCGRYVDKYTVIRK